MADDKLIEKIETFLSGGLSPSDASEFQSKMEADPSLREEVELHRLTLRAMHQLSENDLQAKVLGWMENMPKGQPPKHPPSRQKWFWFSLAAILLLLAGVYGVKRWGIAKNNLKQIEIDDLKKQLEAKEQEILELIKRPVPSAVNMDSLNLEFQKLRDRINELEASKNPKIVRPIASVEAFYESPYIPLATRATDMDSIIVAKYNQAVTASSIGDFERAVALSQEIIAIEATDMKAVRLLAHTYFRMNRYIEAIPQFEMLVKVSAYKEEAEWNLLLCHKALSAVDAHQKELFENQLNEIIKKPGHRFFDNAKELIRANN